MGPISEDDFAVVETRPPRADAGEVVTRTLFLSLDPYLALRFLDAPAGGATGGVIPITARTIGEVVDPGASTFDVGDKVLGFGRWATVDARPASALRKLDAEAPSLSAHLGVLGHSGFTAWLGLRIGRAAAGETLLVSGAAGAVGSVAGQIAKLSGCRVIGIAGGPQKARWVTDALGFDVCIDHRAGDLEREIAAAAPDGVDFHFENVGSATLDPALANLRRGGRIVLCGLMQHYQDREPVCLRNFRRILERSIRIEPFSIYDHEDLFPEAYAQLADGVRTGKLKARETIVDGIERAPAEFVRMLQGVSAGKRIIRVGR